VCLFVILSFLNGNIEHRNMLSCKQKHIFRRVCTPETKFNTAVEMGCGCARMILPIPLEQSDVAELLPWDVNSNSLNCSEISNVLNF
jgi:hypothetical protein